MAAAVWVCREPGKRGRGPGGAACASVQSLAQGTHGSYGRNEDKGLSPGEESTQLYE